MTFNCWKFKAGNPRDAVFAPLPCFLSPPDRSLLRALLTLTT